MHGRSVPADEVRLHPSTPFQHSFFCIKSCSDARDNGRRCDYQQHPPYRWISRALVRQRPGPGKPRLLVLFHVCIGTEKSWWTNTSCVLASITTMCVGYLLRQYGAELEPTRYFEPVGLTVLQIHFVFLSLSPAPNILLCL